MISIEKGTPNTLAPRLKKFMLNSAEHDFFLLIYVKMPTSVGILTFMSWKNSILGLSEHEKTFITSGPGLFLQFIAFIFFLFQLFVFETQSLNK